MKDTKKKEKKVDDGFDSLCHAVGKYIQAHGGKAIVVGPISIEHGGGFRYTFRIDFTGKPPKADEK